MSHTEPERFSDYIDDALEATERAEIDAHLASCEICTETLEALRGVVRQARILGSMEPATDLWMGIEARIGAVAAPAQTIETVRAGEPAPSSTVAPVAATPPVPIASHPRWYAAAVRLTFPQMAAAGLLIAAVSGGAAWWLVNATGGSAPSRVVAGSATVIDAATAGTHDTFPEDPSYAVTIADLEKTLERGSDRLDPATVQVLRDNLAIIDAAIADSRHAIEADPESPYLYRHLNQQMKRKVDLLQQANVYAFAGH